MKKGTHNLCILFYFHKPKEKVFTLPNNEPYNQTELAESYGITKQTMNNYMRMADMIPELEDIIETNIRQRGIGNPNPMKLGRCIKELERIYGIKQGGSGYYGNQYEESSNNYKTPKTEEEIAKEIGISIASLQNYKKLTELVPELQDWVETGILAPTTAIAYEIYRSTNNNTITL